MNDIKSMIRAETRKTGHIPMRRVREAVLSEYHRLRALYPEQFDDYTFLPDTVALQQFVQFYARLRGGIVGGKKRSATYLHHHALWYVYGALRNIAA